MNELRIVMDKSEEYHKSLNVLIDAEIAILYREYKYSPVPQKKLDANKIIIEGPYAPFSAFVQATNDYIEHYLLPLIDLIIERISEIRIENRLPFQTEDTKLLKAIKNIVLEEWEFAIYSGYCISSSHVLYHNMGHTPTYKDRELSEYKERQLKEQPSELLEMVSDKVKKIVGETNLRIKKMNEIDAQTPRKKPEEIDRGSIYIDRIETYIEEISYMGDQIQVNGSENHIINRSIFQHAFNKVKADYDDETANAIKRVAEEINKSGNKEAAENFEAFSEELSKPQPKKSLLKSLWEGTLSALPTLAQTSSVVSLIVRLFN
ncbi:MAG: hypothetical protein RLZZ507_3563 [Cyanobacteriota bacterium]|jgi:predicted metal-dependent hydrolase